MGKGRRKGNTEKIDVDKGRKEEREKQKRMEEERGWGRGERESKNKHSYGKEETAKRKVRRKVYEKLNGERKTAEEM